MSSLRDRSKLEERRAWKIAVKCIEKISPDVAQSVERRAYTSVVPGSSPGVWTNFCKSAEQDFHSVNLPLWSQVQVLAVGQSFL